ncbi:MAG: carbamate kinase [Bacteroidales bacterium]|nr:carbamate kinase [Bacteroidales bacterium]
MKKLAVVALGGNALLRSEQKGTYLQQIDNVEQTCSQIGNLLDNYNVIIAHGNGPQVGNILLQNEAGKEKFQVEDMPLDYCVAQTQGSIGYLIDMCMRNVMRKRNIKRNVVTLLTQVTVDGKDKGFSNPTKPVGPYYTKENAEVYAQATGAVFKEDAKGRGWRKVVASPVPLTVENVDLVKKLSEEGNIIVTVGGGGIPVVEDKDGMIKGVEAVIDKDLASAVTAVAVKADEFYILTDVSKVYINFRKENEKALDVLSVQEAEKLLEEGQFGEGSMAPKIRAALYFIKNGGKECIITDASQLSNPSCGTRIVK